MAELGNWSDSAPVAANVELQRGFTGRQAEQRISELIVPKDAIAVLIGIPCAGSTASESEQCTAQAAGI